jgi:uncharacterized protein (TIGR00251 family)
MNPSGHQFRDGKNGVAITVRVTPRSKKNEIVSILEDGTIKIRLTAPPLEGRANKVLIQYLSSILEVPVSRIEIVAGETNKDKLISILEMDAETLHQRIMAAVNPA